MNEITSEHLVEVLRVVAARLSEAREHLAELDGAIGDADHGSSMSNGFAAVVPAVQDAAAAGKAPGEILAVAGQAFLDSVGATTGPLYAGAFRRAGERLGQERALPDGALIDILAAMAEGIAQRGKAAPGDKTMMDAWGPAVRAAQAELVSGGTVAAALGAGARAAAEGRDETRAMIASRGRAARLGARSLGHVDPGAASAAIVVAAFAEAHVLLFPKTGGTG